MNKIIASLAAALIICSAAQAAHLVDTPAATSHPVARVAKADSKIPVDINTADINTLATLKGIGSKKAQAIVNYREQHGNFKSIEELAMVKGLSQKALARLVKNNPNRIFVKP